MVRIRENHGNGDVASDQESSNVQVASSPPSFPPPPTSSTGTSQDAGITGTQPNFAAIQNEVDAERTARLKKYEVNYAQMLRAKYFSEKGFNGEDIFEKETNVGAEIIKSSRFPCTTSFIGPVEAPKDETTTTSSAVETSDAPDKNMAAKEETGGSNDRGN